MVALLIYALLTKVFVVIRGVISVVMAEGVDLGINRPATIIFAITKKVVMVMGEADKGLRTTNIPTIAQVIVVYC